MFLAFPRQLDQQKRAQALAMLADANRVEKMEHHSLVYFLPEAFERLHFFSRTTHQQTFQEAFREVSHRFPEHADLRDDLTSLINFYLEREMDVLVVDQTAPEHHCCGLRCVKVMMPGMLPMTFGQNNRRVTGFKRLHQLPLTLGYQSHSLTMEEIINR